MSPPKQVKDINLILKDSDMESEHLSLLIRLSVSDGQKRVSSKDVSFIRNHLYVINLYNSHISYMESRASINFQIQEVQTSYP